MIKEWHIRLYAFYPFIVTFNVILLSPSYKRMCPHIIHSVMILYMHIRLGLVRCEVTGRMSVSCPLSPPPTLYSLTMGFTDAQLPGFRPCSSFGRLTHGWIRSGWVGYAIWEISLVYAWRTDPLHPARGCSQNCIQCCRQHNARVRLNRVSVVYVSSYSTLGSWGLCLVQNEYTLLYFWLGACHTVRAPFFAGCNDGAVFIHTHTHSSY